MGKRFKLGIFELFNLVEIYFTEKDSQGIIEDFLNYKSFYKITDFNLYRYLFVSKVSKTILRFVSFPDNEVFNLLIQSLSVYQNFNFNLVRFWVNLATILGFSIQSLKKPGWINLIFLTSCNRNEVKNPYCVFLPPKEFAILKRIMNENTTPFKINKKDLENLERFFFKFFTLQRESF